MKVAAESAPNMCYAAGFWRHLPNTSPNQIARNVQTQNEPPIDIHVRYTWTPMGTGRRRYTEWVVAATRPASVASNNSTSRSGSVWTNPYGGLRDRTYTPNFPEYIYSLWEIQLLATVPIHKRKSDQFSAWTDWPQWRMTSMQGHKVLEKKTRQFSVWNGPQHWPQWSVTTVQGCKVHRWQCHQVPLTSSSFLHLNVSIFHCDQQTLQCCPAVAGAFTYFLSVMFTISFLHQSTHSASSMQQPRKYRKHKGRRRYS